MKSRRRFGTGAQRKLALGTLLCIVAAAGWQANDADASTNTYTPTPGVTFNNPYGSTGSQYAIENKVVNSIAAAPAGSDVTIVTYNFTYPRAADAMIAADARGVHVRVLVAAMAWWDPQTKRLRSALGTDKADQSFITHCSRACMSDQEGSSMHAKFYLFSKAGNASHVAMFGSSNLSINSAELAWNNQYTTVGEPQLYALLYKYFLDMMSSASVKGPPVCHEDGTGLGPGGRPWVDDRRCSGSGQSWGLGWAGLPGRGFWRCR